MFVSLRHELQLYIFLKHLFLLSIFILGKKIQYRFIFPEDKNTDNCNEVLSEVTINSCISQITTIWLKRTNKREWTPKCFGCSRYHVLIDYKQVLPWDTQTCIARNLFSLYPLHLFLYWITDRGATYCIKYSKICKHVWSKQPQIYSSCLKSNLLWTQTCSLHLLHAVGYIPKRVILLFQNSEMWSVQACRTKCFIKNAADTVSILQGKGLQSVGNFSSQLQSPFLLNLKNDLLTSPKEPI